MKDHQKKRKGAAIKKKGGGTHFVGLSRYSADIKEKIPTTNGKYYTRFFCKLHNEINEKRRGMISLKNHFYHVNTPLNSTIVEEAEIKYMLKDVFIPLTAQI